MKQIIYSIAFLSLISSCASETSDEENLTIDQIEAKENEGTENKVPDLSHLNLPTEAFVFDSIAEITATAKINNQEYLIFSSADPKEFDRMSKVMSTTSDYNPGCSMYLGIITFTFQNGDTKYVEFNCHQDCHYVTYFTEEAIVTRELTQDGIEYLNELLINPASE